MVLLPAAFAAHLRNLAPNRREVGQQGRKTCFCFVAFSISAHRLHSWRQHPRSEPRSSGDCFCACVPVERSRFAWDDVIAGRSRPEWWQIRFSDGICANIDSQRNGCTFISHASTSRSRFKLRVPVLVNPEVSKVHCLTSGHFVSKRPVLLASGDQ